MTSQGWRIVKRAAPAVGGALIIIGAVAGCDEPDTGPPDTSGEALRGMAPRAPGAEPGAVTVEDEEPNDVPEQAISLESSPEGTLRVEGVLSGGGADVDIYRLPKRTGAAALSVVPLTDADVLIGISTRETGAPVWFDQAVATGTEWVPNLRLTDTGTLLYVAGRGREDIGYRVEIDLLDAERAETEPNDSDAEADAIVLGGTTTAYANRSGDRDVYRLPAFADAPVTLSVSPPGAQHPLVVSLENNAGTIWEAVAEGGHAVTFQGLRPDPMGYTLRVELVGETDKPRVYTVAIEQRVSSGDLELEPNDTLQSAQVIDAGGGGPLSAALSSGADVDWYTTTLTPLPGDAATIATVRVVPAESAAALDLAVQMKHVEDGLAATLDAGRAGDAEMLCNLAITDSATLELAISRSTAGSNGTAAPGANNLDAAALPGGAYIVEVATRVATNEEVEPNANNLQPTQLMVGHDAPLAGYIHPEGDVDVYQFTVPANPADPTNRTRAVATIDSGYAADLKLELRDAQFSEVSKRNSSGYGDGESIAAQLPGGDYFLVVSAVEGASCARPYGVSVTLEAPVGTVDPDRLIIPNVDDEPGDDISDDTKPPPTEEPAIPGEDVEDDAPPETLGDDGLAPPSQLGEDDF